MIIFSVRVKIGVKKLITLVLKHFKPVESNVIWDNMCAMCKNFYVQSKKINHKSAYQILAQINLLKRVGVHSKVEIQYWRDLFENCY